MSEPVNKSEVPKPATPKSRRRWLQFRFRTLLVLVALAGMLFAWVHRAREQQQIVRALQAVGRGTAWCDYGPPNADGTYAASTLSVPKSWRGTLAVDLFYNIKYVSLSTPTLAQVQVAMRFRRLETLKARLSDAELAGLSGLAANSSLRHLDLSNYVNVTDVGLGHIAGLKNLESLKIVGGEWTDRGARHLGQLKRLEKLELLDHSDFTNEGLRSICALPRLRELALTGPMAAVDDEGLKSFSSMRLTRLALDLSGTQVSDAGLASLGSLTSLEQLRLVCGPIVTDAGIAQLKSLTNLRALSVAVGKDVSADGVAALTELPNLESLVLQPRLAYFTLHGVRPNAEVSAPVLPITDEFLGVVAEMRGLKSLSLQHCPKLTDACLAHLERLTSLDHLEFCDCAGISEGAVYKLKAVLPHCICTLDRGSRDLNPTASFSHERDFDVWFER